MRSSEEVGILVLLSIHSLTPMVAEDVLGDLGVRQALKSMPKDARL